MGNIVLTKESSEKEIKAYFAAVLKLTESQNEFPVNLDEVWPLVYGKKSDAVEVLKRTFIEGIDFKALTQNGKQVLKVFPKNGENPKGTDFQILRKNPQNSQGGRPATDYYLTVPCMEFFIARKVRPVFEVYRQVFHTTAKNVAAAVPAPKLSEKLMWVREVKKLLNLNETSTLSLLEKLVSEPNKLPLPDYTPSKGILKSATELLKERGMDLTARDFNLQAMLKGYLCEQTRKSSNGGAKTFKAITEKGRPYGENQVSPKNPRETQPLWYADKFGELLKELGIDLKKED